MSIKNKLKESSKIKVHFLVMSVTATSNSFNGNCLRNEWKRLMCAFSDSLPLLVAGVRLSGQLAHSYKVEFDSSQCTRKYSRYPARELTSASFSHCDKNKRDTAA